MNDWMKNLPDDLLVSEINLPGTHNSGTEFIALRHYSRCQSKNIFSQLSMGIRFLDIRINSHNESLTVVHSFLTCKKGKNKKTPLLFSDVLSACTLFLKENPTESVLLCVKSEDSKENSYAFDLLYKNYIENSELFYTENSIPTLKEARGKIILLNRCGADIDNSLYTDKNCGINLSGWPYQKSKNEASLQKIPIARREGFCKEYFYLQDFFRLNPKKKWETAILPALENPPQDKAIILNFFSGSNGFSSPKRYTRLIYKRFFEYKLQPMKKYGWFILDFPNEEVIRKIILSNY